jgi:hypothetical protein
VNFSLTVCIVTLCLSHEERKNQERNIMRTTNLLILCSLFIVPSLFSLLPATAAAGNSPVHMATDKTRYAQGEPIKLSVTNATDIPVWYIGYSQPDLVFWALERANKESWLSMGFRLLSIEGGKAICRIVHYERPVGVVRELSAQSNLDYEWSQEICRPQIVTKSSAPELLEQGQYRFVLRYSVNTVKAENIEDEPWKRPIDLGEKEMVYSNAFTVE